MLSGPFFASLFGIRYFLFLTDFQIIICHGYANRVCPELPTYGSHSCRAFPRTIKIFFDMFTVQITYS